MEKNQESSESVGCWLALFLIVVLFIFLLLVLVLDVVGRYGLDCASGQRKRCRTRMKKRRRKECL